MFEVTCLDSYGGIVRHLTQWDQNITLKVTGIDIQFSITPFCHFCNAESEEAYVVDTTLTEDGFNVKVPNILLTESSTIFLYVFAHGNDDSGKTIYTIRIPVRKRAKPQSYIFEDNVNYIDVYVINSRISELFKMITENPEYTGEAELIDIRIGYDGIVYDTAGEAVRALGRELQDVKDELLQYIDKKAVNGLSYENNMLSLTADGEPVGESVEIVGGSGGSGGASTVVKLVNLNGTSMLSAALGQPVVLQFNFTSTEDDVPTGDGTCRIMVNGLVRSTINIHQGATSIDVSEYLSSGSNTVRITCTDTYGNYRNLNYTVSIIELTLSSTFDDSVTYNEDVLFKYTPTGVIEKTVHFLLDEADIGTTTVTASGRQTTKVISKQSHGVHTLEVYMTAFLDGQQMESNHLIYDVMFVDPEEVDPMIASAYQVTSIKQGNLVSIPYIVYDPTKLSCEIELTIYSIVGGQKTQYSKQNLTVDRSKQYWNTRRYPVGTVEFEIKYGSISKSYRINVEENIIDVEAATNDLDVFLSSVGRSNNEANPAVWENNNITTTFANMNWTSNGWIEDSNGDVALKLNGDATATINIKPFDSDLKIYGKTIEIEFAIRDVNNRDAIVISCMNGGIGFTITADTATFKSEQTSIDCKYCDEEKIRLAFVVESRSEYRMLSIYLNGILSGVKQYPNNDNFQQSSPVAISIGSEYCAIDVYTVRVYSTALSPIEVRDNYIADTQDIAMKSELNEANDIYDDYDNISYEKTKNKIPVMTIIGDLPQSKGDKKNVWIKYEDCFHPDFNFDDTCSIDVQGTSSQYYVVKNYKEKFGIEHQNAENQMPIKVFCLKADYAEATGTHNTANGNLVHTLYSDKTPAQEDNELCRTSIYGFPCVLFHQKTETSEPTFVGKYNFNADKGAENLFGFTEDYDVESWEFLNNTSDACNFKGAFPEDWSNDFEARYPDGNSDVARLKAVHDWIVSTKGDVQKFKTEFEEHFNLHKCLIYYVYTFVMLMVDQRAKNMFFTYWGKTQKWEPWFYDNDTCLGINNEGQLVFDYYHEDTDKLNDANVYNGQESVFWCNFREAFPEQIQETYQNLRNNGKITYDILYDYFITNASDKWCISIYNDDSEYKYISMLKSDGDGSNLPQVRGNGKEHFKYFVKNRLMYCDSKWYASDYANDYVSLRIYTPSQYQGVEPNADITVTPFSTMYAGVKYKANGTLQQQRATKNVPCKFEAPDETFNDTETAIYGASELSSLGDLSPLYCGSINVSMATKLTELIIGNITEGYSNPNLNSLSIGTNALLKKIDIQNCPNLTDALGLANCPNIEEIYAKGSGITSIELGKSGFLKIIQLPATITNLTLQNQQNIQELTLEGYDAIKTLQIENCPTISKLDILKKCQNLERLRLTGLTTDEWNFEDVTYLQSLYSIGGIDENGYNSEYPALVGTCHITTLTGAEMEDINVHYPYLNITYDSLTATLTYMSEDGSHQLYQEVIANGGDGNYKGTTPAKSSTDQYTYSFVGWALKPNQTVVNDNALKGVTADRTVYAVFEATVRTYTVRFYNDTELLETVNDVPYGGTARYTKETPTKKGVENPDDYEFSGWNPSPSNIKGDTSCYAQFTFTGYIQDDWDVIATNVLNGTYKTVYGVGGLKELTLDFGDTQETIEVEIAAFDHDDKADSEGGGKAGITFIAKQLLATSQSNTSSGGWEQSAMRTYCNETIYNALPEKLKQVIKTVKKVSDGGYSNQVEITTEDKVWIPSYHEVGLTGSEYAVGQQGTQYDIFTDANSRKRSKKDASSSTAWWLRSSYVRTNSYFWGVHSVGEGTYYSIYGTYGVAPCFCI